MECEHLNFHAAWIDALGDVSNEEAEKTIQLIEKLRHTMPGITPQSSR